MGGGCALAMACDFRIADASARFAIPAAKLGVVYGQPECTLLTALVGVSTAKRILYTGDPLDAREAFRVGLVDEIADAALSAAEILAGRMLGNAPLSISGSKTILNALAQGEAKSRSGELLRLVENAIQSEDYREGALAFVEKRKPNFQGR